MARSTLARFRSGTKAARVVDHGDRHDRMITKLQNLRSDTRSAFFLCVLAVYRKHVNAFERVQIINSIKIQILLIETSVVALFNERRVLGEKRSRQERSVFLSRLISKTIGLFAIRSVLV